ncbi:MAG: M1 family aminopeptidase [Pyrinomonadaceae bacterium]
MLFSASTFAQTPQIEPGVSLELAKWRASRYSDVRYKLSLTLEKMSPVLKGTIEIRVTVGAGTLLSPSAQGAETRAIILDWRKIKGHEDKSTISNVSINGKAAVRSSSFSWPPAETEASLGSGGPPKGGTPSFGEFNEHLIFSDGVVLGENVIKLDFTSPILTSGSAITRYVDKEDGSEYLYSLFVPSDASTAFPVFDQPDIKARFKLIVRYPGEWLVVSNANEPKGDVLDRTETSIVVRGSKQYPTDPKTSVYTKYFEETKPISTYVFAFAAGPFEKIGAGTLLSPRASLRRPQEPSPKEPFTTREVSSLLPARKVFGGGTADGDRSVPAPSIYVRKSQAAKFKPHAAEVFRLNREAVKYFEEYFDYKFPFPKYDLVLIPEFPFGGMEHAGATFLRESSIIFPQEPTRNDHISRAVLIFHEAAHQWFGDTVTMRWFDDLWLKEGFATFMAYKAMEKIMPEMNAWKVFYERVKQAAYQTDSTRGTTAIYQPIANLSAAKSAYGAIVYSKAPAFLRQAEFYLGEDKFQTAVRAFLKKHEFGNAGWEDLVKEFETASGKEELRSWWAEPWVKHRGMPLFDLKLVFQTPDKKYLTRITQRNSLKDQIAWSENTRTLIIGKEGKRTVDDTALMPTNFDFQNEVSAYVGYTDSEPQFVFPNYGDYGYGIFLLDEKSREYVLKNIQNELDPFLRSMMWGALWDSVREGELDPREYVELVVKALGTAARSSSFSWPPAGAETSRGNLGPPKGGTPNFVGDDESTTALLLNRVGTAMNYYIDEGVRSPHVSKGSSRPADTLVSKDKPTPAPDGQAPDEQHRALTNVRATDTGGLHLRVEEMLIAGMQNSPTLGQRITYYRAFLNIASSEKARGVLKQMLTAETQRRGADTGGNPSSSEGVKNAEGGMRNAELKNTLHAGRVSALVDFPLRTKDKFDIVTRLLILNDPDAPKLLAELEKTETSGDAKRYAYAAKAGIGTVENKAKYWNDFVNNKEISESWIEAAFGPWNSIRHSDLTLPYLQKALQALPDHKRNRKIFFVNGWLGAFIGGQRSKEALAIVNEFLADNPNLDNDLRLKILENVDLIERAVKIRGKYGS